MRQHMKKIIITGIITVSPMLVGVLMWNKMPDMVAIRWGNDNVANGWSSKTFAVFGLPLFLLAAQIVCVFITLNDPKRRNIGPKLLSLIFWIIPVVSWGCCMVTYITAAGMNLNIGMMGSILVGVMFIVVGNYMPKGKQSYTVGIKLPWTLNSTENWNQTTRLAGKIWIAVGIIFIADAFVQIENLRLAAVLVMIFVPAAYSFLLYKKGV